MVTVPSVTFRVSEVVPAATGREPSPDPLRALGDLLETSVEACSRFPCSLISSPREHALIRAVGMAFDAHYPLALSPDMLWLAVLQGIAAHINANPESLRDRLVSHQGKLKLQVRRDDFMKGSKSNPWPEVFEGFSTQIQGHAGELATLLRQRFSTTGANESAAFQIGLMDAVKSYFSYELITLCGIPSVTLLGTEEDWQSLRQNVAHPLLATLGLDEWSRALAAVLDQFVLAVQGRADVEFWQSIYNYRNMSGGPRVTGWISVFCPYLADGRPNSAIPALAQGRLPADFACPEDGNFPTGISAVPLVWNYMGQLLDMQIFGGFLGVLQDPQTLALLPGIGWAIAESEPSKTRALSNQESDKPNKMHRSLREVGAELKQLEYKNGFFSKLRGLIFRR